MRVWIKKHIGLLVGGVLIVLLLGCFGTVLILTNTTVNKMLWAWAKPEKYYIKIRYGHEHICSRTWESVWEDHNLINIISNEVSVNDLCTEEDLNIAEWSMDYIFDVIVGNCGKGPGAVLCSVEYDPRFHYPSRVTSFYTYVFEVQDFIVCEIDKPSCP